MNVYWVLENSKKLDPFYLSPLELKCMENSIKNWKKFYPETTTHIYCDATTKPYLESNNLLNLWDVVNTEVLSKPDEINRTIFWTASKLKVMNEIKAPFIMMDIDFLVLTNKLKLGELQYFTFVGTQAESNKMYADPNKMPYSGLIQMFDILWNNDHVMNMSFMYVRDEDIRKEFTYVSRLWEEILTYSFRHTPHSTAEMTFVEQSLLTQLCTNTGLRIASLTKELHESEKPYFNYPPNWTDLGLRYRQDFHHLGDNKRMALFDQDVFGQQMFIITK
jgi:hypothetical protein